ncbi:hypothetical protein ACHMW6_15470 [Pseudoduganella sp. UC29_106]|uniref:hypothetical protein n=1 Tax=Pseudoduganella sp. UC29_106 TaxID=3374553 RepID=UPI003756D3B2
MAAPTIDGSVGDQRSTASSGTVTLTTTQTNDIIIIVAYCENPGSAAPTVTSVTGGGLTFALRCRSNGSSHGNLEVWWALAPSALSSVTFTVNYTGTFDDATFLAYGVHGCNTAAPWDSNAGLPQKQSYNGAATPSFTLNTSQSDDLILFSNGVLASSSAIPADPSGFTNITSKSNGGGAAAASSRSSCKGVTSVQSGVTVAASAAGSGNNGGECILDVLTANSAVIPQRRPQVFTMC